MTGRRLILLLCLGLSVLAAPAWAAIAEVGSGSQRATYDATGANGNVDSADLAYPGNVTANNLLVCAGANWRNTGATIAVSDTRGTSYTVLSTTLATNITLFIAYGIAPSSGANTVTVDPTSTGNYPSFSCDEFSGVHTSTPLDVDGGSSTNTGTAVSDSLTTLTANALLIGVMTHSASMTYTLTPGGSYTQIGEVEDNSGSTAFNAVFRIVTTATSYDVDWTLGTSATWAAYTAAFKPAAAGNPGIRRRAPIWFH